MNDIYNKDDNFKYLINSGWLTSFAISKLVMLNVREVFLGIRQLNISEISENSCYGGRVRTRQCSSKYNRSLHI